jgi:hypothetical protein
MKVVDVDEDVKNRERIYRDGFKPVWRCRICREGRGVIPEKRPDSFTPADTRTSHNDARAAWCTTHTALQCWAAHNLLAQPAGRARHQQGAGGADQRAAGLAVEKQGFTGIEFKLAGRRAMGKVFHGGSIQGLAIWKESGEEQH